MPKTIHIATRGSALALVQANQILDLCRTLFPDRTFALKVMKTTGDKLQTASLANPEGKLPKGLFTKELEVALLNGEADLAVHSLKDLPTELPEELKLGAVTEREDPRDVLVTRQRLTALQELPERAVVASSSPRRQMQLKQLRTDLHTVEIRGNVGTRLRKLAENVELHGTLLAAAGMRRLGYEFGPGGELTGPDVPDGLYVLPMERQAMIPAVGQAAIGIETRGADPEIDSLCARLNHLETWQCITAERGFLNAMGGGCQSPVAAHAIVSEGRLEIEAVSFQTGDCRLACGSGEPAEAELIGRSLAETIDAPRLA